MKYVIAAATSGVGRELAKRLAGEGHALLLTGRNGDRLAEIGT